MSPLLVLAILLILMPPCSSSLPSHIDCSSSSLKYCSDCHLIKSPQNTCSLLKSCKLHKNCSMNLNVSLHIEGRNHINCSGFSIHVNVHQNLHVSDITWIGCKIHVNITDKRGSDKLVRFNNNTFNNHSELELLGAVNTVLLSKCDFLQNNLFSLQPALIHGYNEMEGSKINIFECNFSYNTGNLLVFNGKGVTIHLTDTTFTHNTGETLISFDTDSSSEVYYHNNTLTNNIGKLLVFNGTGVTIDITDTTFTHNTGETLISFDTDSSSKVYYHNNTLTNNTGKLLVFNGTGVTIDITDTTFTHNTGETLISFDTDSSSKVYYHNNTLTNNTGKLLVFNGTGVTIDITDTTFTHNTGETLISFDTDSSSEVYYHNNTLTNNTGKLPNNTGNLPRESYAVLVSHVNITISNSNFTSNKLMTPLAIFDDSWIHFTGQNVIFENNSANFGGGMAIFGAEPAISSSPDTSLKFSNNVAQVYGGAIYVSYQSTSLSFLCNIISSNLSFNNNTAKIAGNEIYIGNPNLLIVRSLSSASCLSFLLDYTTQPSSFRYIDSVSVFLGQYIPIQLPTIDSSICNISSSLRASFSSNECTLNIDSQSYKELPRGRPSAYMYVNGSGCNNSQFDLIFSCETSISALTVNINIKTCPLGFSEEFDDICQCHEDLYCSRDTGEVCIQKGMNYNIDESIVYDCISPYCNTTYQPCTIANTTDEYKLLLPQYQCIDDRSGLSCSECKDNLTIFTYQAVRCVANESMCIPGLIIIMVVVLQVFLSVLMLLTLKLTQHVGAGGLYTLLFYVAVLYQLTFFSNQLEQYLPLYHLILFINTFLFVDSKMLGLLPICSLNVGQLSQAGLQYLGPFITILTSFLALVIFYVIPRLRKYQSFLSFQRMLALSFLVVYWKFISTSVYIMIPVTINEYTRVYLQPSLAYLTCEHIPLWLLALAVIAFYILLTNLLLLSPLLAKIKKLKIIYRQINMFLHFYTISFKDRFKWYPAVYFIAFFVIIIFKFSPEFQQFVFIVLLTLQYLCRPYQYNWMNISDALLLMSLILASSLVNSNIPLFYIISILSLLYILIVGISLVLYTSGFLDLISRKVKCLSYLRTKFTMTNHEVDVVITDDSNNESFSFDEIVMIDAATTGYREPLLDPLITRNDTFDISLPQYGINS